MKSKSLSLALILSAGMATFSNATIVGFGQLGGNNTMIPGGLASRASVDGNGYVVSNGATPNIAVTWDPEWDIHTSNFFSALENRTVGGGAWDNEGNVPRIGQLDLAFHTISFAADAQYALVLNSFDFVHTAETAGTTVWNLTLTNSSSAVVWSRDLTMNNADVSSSLVTVAPNFTGELGESYLLTFSRASETYGSNGRHGID
ncbi:MAG: hypothetical protein EOP85_12635, partial [Verrucomicrobiaceae bacterium]